MTITKHGLLVSLL